MNGESECGKRMEPASGAPCEGGAGTPAHPLRGALRKAIRSALKRAEGKLEKLGAELRECGQAQQYLECGELIKAHLALVRRGEAEIELPDLYHPGSTRKIALDPKLKPLDNAKKYFKRQRKLLDGREVLGRQVEICRRELEGLRVFADNYSRWEAENPPELPPAPELAEGAAALRIHIEGLEPPKTPQQIKRATPPGVREFLSHDGLTIWVGKSAQDNDTLSIRVARGNDWWFHIAHLQGSHVVVRHPGGAKGAEQLPPETLLDAAHLAAYFSKGRQSTRPEVHYCQAKNVSKAKGSPAGQVVVNNGKTLSLRIEEPRLQRLLKGADVRELPS